MANPFDGSGKPKGGAMPNNDYPSPPPKPGPGSAARSSDDMPQGGNTAAETKQANPSADAGNPIGTFPRGKNALPAKLGG